MSASISLSRNSMVKQRSLFRRRSRCRRIRSAAGERVTGSVGGETSAISVSYTIGLFSSDEMLQSDQHAYSLREHTIKILVFADDEDLLIVRFRLSVLVRVLGGGYAVRLGLRSVI
jgi:hypothetical protein